METQILIGIVLFGSIISLISCVFIGKVFFYFREQNRSLLRELTVLETQISEKLRLDRQETGNMLNRSISGVGQALVNGQSQMSYELGIRQQQSQQAILEQLRSMEQHQQGTALQSQHQLEAIRQTVQQRLEALQKENSQKLEQMRQTVDEKLQKTLEARLGQSFRSVESHLEQVHRGLGEMQALAAGVGDLKKVLSNVKTRGILGEIQLGSILEEILTSTQYRKNVITKHGSHNPVEYAVVLPGSDGEILLPIDAKFPADAYWQLNDAYEQGDQALILTATATLSARIKSFAKDIRDKYLDPPHTTDAREASHGPMPSRQCAGHAERHGSLSFYIA